jgi:hypothetical protein
VTININAEMSKRVNIYPSQLNGIYAFVVTTVISNCIDSAKVV